MKYRLVKRERPHDPYEPNSMITEYLIERSSFGIFWLEIHSDRDEDRAIEKYKKYCRGRIKTKRIIMDKTYFAWKNLLQ